MVSPLNKKTPQFRIQVKSTFFAQEEDPALRQLREDAQKVHERIPIILKTYMNFRIAMKRLELDLEKLQRLDKRELETRDEIIRQYKMLYDEYANDANKESDMLRRMSNSLTEAYHRPNLYYYGIDDQQPDLWLADKLEALEKEIKENDYQEPRDIILFLQQLDILETEEPEIEEQLSSGLGFGS